MKEEIKKRCGIYYLIIMETYCVCCKKNNANKIFSVRRTKQNTLILVSNYAVSAKKKSRFCKY